MAISSLLILAPSAIVSANSSKQPTGITISPAYQQIDILNSESQQLVTFKVTHNEY